MYTYGLENTLVLMPYSLGVLLSESEKALVTTFGQCLEFGSF